MKLQFYLLLVVQRQEKLYLGKCGTFLRFGKLTLEECEWQTIPITHKNIVRLWPFILSLYRVIHP